MNALRRFVRMGRDYRVWAMGTTQSAAEHGGSALVMGLVEEGDGGAAGGAGFFVHVDAVPDGEGDGGVVGVADAASDVEVGVASHGSPLDVSRGGVGAEALSVFGDGEADGGEVGDHDGFAAAAIGFVDGVGLGAEGAAERFFLEDEPRIDVEVGCGDEEPLALAEERGVLAAGALGGVEGEAALGDLHTDGLEGLHGGGDIADAAVVGDTGDEPVAFVVTAEELEGLVGVGGECVEEEVPRVGRDTDGVCLGLGVELDIEEFAAALGDDVDREGRAGRAAEHGPEPGEGTESGEGPFEVCNVHITTLTPFAMRGRSHSEGDEEHGILRGRVVRGGGEGARWGKRGESAERRVNTNRSDPFRSVPKGVRTI